MHTNIQNSCLSISQTVQIEIHAYINIPNSPDRDSCRYQYSKQSRSRFMHISIFLTVQIEIHAYINIPNSPDRDSCIYQYSKQSRITHINIPNCLATCNQKSLNIFLWHEYRNFSNIPRSCKISPSKWSKVSS